MSDPKRQFDTSRSDARIEAWRNRKFVARRRVIRFTRNVPAEAQEIFPQLCPTRESDWIDGWESEIVFSETGYGEEQCVFRTDENNATGPGLWTFSHVEAPCLLKIVRVNPPLLQHLTVELEELGDGTTDVHWTATLTALSDEGNRALGAMPKDDEAYAGSAEALAYYFREGRMQESGTAGAPAHGLMSEAAKWIRKRTAR